MNKLPNFLVVGAAKSGTSSLYCHLFHHPDIYLPEIKELRFFSQMPDFQGPGDELINAKITKTVEQYSRYFSRVNDEKAIGDVSPDYLYYYQDSIKSIEKYLSSSTKIVMTLRNPVDRAYSNYMHFLLEGRETLSFEKACAAEEERQNKNWEWAWSYQKIGLYYNQVKAYVDHFDKVKIILFDELISENKVVLDDLYAFLDVDPYFTPKSINQTFNASGIPKNKILHSLLTENANRRNVLRECIKSLIPTKPRQLIKRHLMNRNLKKPPMQPKTRKKLVNFYKDDILKLQDLLQRDLSSWLLE